MNRTFCVTLNREEYLEYLSYQLMQSGHMRGSRWFLLTSVPAVLITGMLLLPYKKMLFFTCVLALAALWILYGAGAVWKSYVRRKAERYYWPKLNIREFQEPVFGRRGGGEGGRKKEQHFLLGFSGAGAFEGVLCSLSWKGSVSASLSPL